MRTHRWIGIAVAVVLVGAPAVAGADDDARAYALVVGSNPGGEGQQTLRFAEDDAARVAEVLRDLAGYDRERVKVLARPTPEALLAAVDELGEAIRRDAEDGARTVLFFYYSGHAKARGLNLGAAELGLAELRESLLSLPTTLTIVVLDACQSGAFSRVKGAEPAADFSFNSVARLDARGVAVMASSSASELSQESERLGGSYFTHYLLVALRGAGDGNRDGRVSLDEAYRYAYQETLAATARTAVGRQHVTLETRLEGKGEIALTYPARSDARLVLPKELTGEVLVRQRASGAVVAEVQKAAGDPVHLAFPRGTYRVLVRGEASLRECDVDLAPGRVTPLDVAACEERPLDDGLSKGVAPEIARWAIELNGGLLRSGTDAYEERLGDFGFHDQILGRLYFTVGGVYRVHDYVQVVGEVGQLDYGDWRRNIDSGEQTFEWTSWGAGVYLRGAYPFARGILVAYAQAGGGMAVARTSFRGPMMTTDRETHFGFHLGVAGGLHVMPWDRFGFTVRLGYDVAPVIDNLVGDTHDAGGARGALGARVAF